MRHTCPDGTYGKLIRTGPVGTMVGVTFTCEHCGYAKSATTILKNTERVLNDPAVRAALR